VVTGGQAFAWNPSIEGTKSEDTILLDETGRHVLTEIAGWPSLPVNINGQALLRPAILEVT
jgi:antitoxin VapB